MQGQEVGEGVFFPLVFSEGAQSMQSIAQPQGTPTPAG